MEEECFEEKIGLIATSLSPTLDVKYEKIAINDVVEHNNLPIPSSLTKHVQRLQANENITCNRCLKIA